MDHIFKLIEQKVLQDKLNITEMILRYIVLVVTIVAASENMCTVLKKGYTIIGPRRYNVHHTLDYKGTEWNKQRALVIAPF